MRSMILTLSAAAVAALAFVSTASGQPYAMGTAFTYQGRLEDGGGPVTATCDFEFSLWDDPTLLTPVGPTLTFDGMLPNPPSIVVTDGLFEAVLDFGAGAFPGDVRWLEIAVWCPGGATGRPIPPQRQRPQAAREARQTGTQAGPCTGAPERTAPD